MTAYGTIVAGHYSTVGYGVSSGQYGISINFDMDNVGLFIDITIPNWDFALGPSLTNGFTLSSTNTDNNGFYKGLSTSIPGSLPLPGLAPAPGGSPNPVWLPELLP